MELSILAGTGMFGGEVQVRTSGGGDSGNINIVSGTSGGVEKGSLSLKTGNSGVKGGSVSFSTGTAATSGSGSISLSSGDSASGVGASTAIAAGDGQTAGTILITAPGNTRLKTSISHAESGSLTMSTGLAMMSETGTIALRGGNKLQIKAGESSTENGGGVIFSSHSDASFCDKPWV
jgi:hypothetical protein